MAAECAASTYDWTLADKTVKCKLYNRWTQRRIALETEQIWAPKDRYTNKNSQADQSPLNISQKSYA